MKTLSLILFGALAAWMPVSSTVAQLGPIWTGPQKHAQWNGFTSLVAATKPGVPSAVAPKDENADVPKWIGFVNRGKISSDWLFRFQLSNQKTEMVRRGATTSDGWTVSGFSAQANHPSSVTVSKDGVDKTLQLTTESSN